LTQRRYSKSFSTIEPTLFNVNEYWFNKDQNRLRDIRPDSLSQILNSASVRPGGKYIVVDEASGIIVAGLLERLGGESYVSSETHSQQVAQALEDYLGSAT
jgi:tRNA (adenine-N(1)-)-methyltransferase non-catalytic subunit